MELNKNLLVILRLVVVLILTINASNFEIYPSIDKYLNRNAYTQIFSLFALCLTFVITVERPVELNDFANAVAATCIFILIARPIDGRYIPKRHMRRGYIDDILNHGWLERQRVGHK